MKSALSLLMQHPFFLKHANVIARSAERNQLKTTPKSDMKQSSLDTKMLADILGFAWQRVNRQIPSLKIGVPVIIIEILTLQRSYSELHWSCSRFQSNLKGFNFQIVRACYDHQ
jgi:hypothetical protein